MLLVSDMQTMNMLHLSYLVIKYVHEISSVFFFLLGKVKVTLVGHKALLSVVDKQF